MSQLFSRRISEKKWQKLENSPHEKQRQFLERYKFIDEPVSSEKRNVRRGDHIYYPGKFGDLYDHHLLVHMVVGNLIYYYDYTGPRGGPQRFLKSSSGSRLSGLAQVDGGCMTYKELEMKQAKIRHWPDELKRYSVDVVIERARSRTSEAEYSIFKNNCEHFVTWCICGLNTSFQVTPTLTVAKDAAVGVAAVAAAVVIGAGAYALFSSPEKDEPTKTKKHSGSLN